MTVKLYINNHPVDARPGDSLFDCADRLEVRVPNSCGKQGKCRECLVEIFEGMEFLTPPTAEERHLRGAFRLACRARIAEGEGVIHCHTMRRSAMRVVDEGMVLAPPDAHQALDPAVTREGGRSGGRILLDGEPIAQSADHIHGLAVDLGTTTVVMRLFNLETGHMVASQAFENPQRFGGSDVMARIKYDTDNPGRLLQRTLLAYMGHVIESFPVDPKTIYEMTVAGNSTMRDLFFGLNVYTIGQRPYRSITEYELHEGKRTCTSLAVKARQLRLPIHPEARVYGLPIISGHVGADTAAGLLAIDIAHQRDVVGMMDIGTNTELVVGNRDRILAASCPAGPAFEGGAIGHGMPGLEGAIEGAWIGADGRVKLDVIGGGEPEGICGSGLIDILGELLRTERMNQLGRFADGMKRFVLHEGNRIAIDEHDISSLAQAKGANVSGLHIVLNTLGRAFEDLRVFYLAGGFARHINLDAARRIGLIPDLPDAKLVKIGNASIEGAAIALRSVAKRRELEELVKRIEHVELETDPSFFGYFVEGCQFMPVRSGADGEGA